MRTPRAAVVAGIVFSILLTTSDILSEWAIPPGSDDAGTWVNDAAKRDAVSLSLQLLPFAGIAFLGSSGRCATASGRARTGSSPPSFLAAACCS